MSGNYYPPFSLRIEETLLEKVKYISQVNKRSANKQIEFIVESFIKEYERENGVIDIEKNL